MGKYCLSLLLFLLCCGVVEAQNTEVNDLGHSVVRASESALSYAREAGDVVAEISINFANNSSTLDASYRDNGVAMQEVESFMRTLLKGECGTRAIIIDGAASPLGNEEYNKRLALRRAEAVCDFLHTIEGSDRIIIHAISDGEDWDSFTHSVLEGYNRPNRDAVLEIIRSELSHDEKEAALRRIDNSGETFRVLVGRHMSSARNAALIRVVEIADLTPRLSPISFDVVVSAPTLLIPKSELQWQVEQPLVADVELNSTTKIEIDGSALKIEPKSEVEKPTEVQESAPEIRKPVMAVRTNLLVPALNVGVEVPIGKHWSVGVDYYFPWIWPKRDNKNCFEFLGWGIEGRYWFGKERTVFDRLQGHSLGLYGYMGYYDFERNYHGHQGEFVNVGIDYTYAMAVGKKKAVHFEFSLGVGYIYSQARKYTVIEANGPLISDKITKTIGFFGPTKANVSLVVPIFQKVSPNDRRRRDEMR